ncbi:hypothetical protein [Verrucosispora sioxanthis]|uniref:hypothetical protein n=1 Tax=Verrucosispora sioxanthis TaxID=2499994 RepID=UPI00209CC627|nr:hypothetical protein [Verrucosispora sioxanthis]
METVGAGAQRVLRIRGINEVLRRVVDEGRLPSELGVSWATAPWRAEPGGQE